MKCTCCLMSVVVLAAFSIRLDAQECDLEAALGIPNVGEFPKLMFPPEDVAQEGTPIWVDASEAFDKEGNLKESLFGGMQSSRMKMELSKVPDAGCLGPNHPMLAALDWRPSNLGEATFLSVDEVLSEAEWVLLGEIVDSEFGFYNGRPRQLFRMRTIASLHREAFFAFYYLAMDVGEGTADGMKFCLSSRGYGFHPSPGDEVVVVNNVPGGFSYNWSEPTDPVIDAHPSEIIMFSKDDVSKPDFIELAGRREFFEQLAPHVQRDGYCYREVQADSPGEPATVPR